MTVVSERAAFTDYSTLGANVSRNTTSPISGASDWKMAYPIGSTTWNTTFIFTPPSSVGPIRKTSVTFLMKFDATPAADATLLQIMGTSVFISVNKKLKVGATETTDAAFATGTVYRIEIIADMDWRGVELGSVICRYRTDGAGVPTTTVQQDFAGVAQANLTFGVVTAKAGTGPNVNVQISDISIVWDTSTTRLATWLNNLTPQTVRFPIANGNYNDFVGVGDATNKYANIDENPSNGNTDFNFAGDMGITRRNSSTFTNVASYVNTVQGFSIWNITDVSKGQNSASDLQLLIRDNSIDYRAIINAGIGVFSSNSFGYPSRPDGTALSAGVLNSLEGGVYVSLLDTNYNTGYVTHEFQPSSDGATYGSVWATTGANRWSVVTDQSNLTYISSNTLNAKQGFGMTWTITPLTSIGDVVYSLTARVTGRTDTNVTGSLIKIGVRISGTDYLTDSQFLIDPSLTDFVVRTQALLWSGSRNNPVTGVRWTKSDLEGAEWYIQLTQLGTAQTIISEFSIDINCASSLLETTEWLEVVTGDNPTENGTIPGVILSTSAVYLTPNFFWGPH